MKSRACDGLRDRIAGHVKDLVGGMAINKYNRVKVKALDAIGLEKTYYTLHNPRQMKNPLIMAPGDMVPGGEQISFN